MKCSVDDCTEAAHISGLCAIHGKLEEWAGNGDINNMGIFRMAFDLFPDRFDSKYGTCVMHREIMMELLQALEHGRNKYDRLHVIAAPREHSKSTVVTFLFVMFCILFKLRFFILIISENDEKAKQFIRSIKSALNRKDVKQYFGDLAPRAVNFFDGQKWSENHLVTAEGQHIMTLGIRQSTRGLLEDIGRPDLIIADDAESESNTKTDEAKRTNWNWWRQQVVPSADIIRGMCVYIGTMFAEDCILGRLLDNKNRYHKRFYQVYVDELETQPLWPEKFTVELIKLIREDYESDEELGLDQYYREYYNIAVAPENRKFGPSSIIEVDDLTFWIDKYRRKWLSVDGKEPFSVETYTGFDPAFSPKNWAAYSVVLSGAVDARGKRYILHYDRGRYDVRDDADSKREGSLNKLMEHVKVFQPHSIGFAVTGLGNPIFSVFRQDLREWSEKEPTLSIPRLVEIKETSDQAKIERIAAILVSPHKLGKIIQKKSHKELKHEQIGFPKTRYFDCLDAEANFYSVSRVPTQIHVYSQEEDLLEELSASEEPEEIDWQTL